MNRTDKEAALADLKDRFGGATSVVLVEFKGLTVEEADRLRSEFRKTDASYLVVKNTLAKLAIKDSPLEALAPYFTGPTAVGFGYEDPAAPAKLVTEFLKDSDHLTLKAGFLDGTPLDENGVKQLAQMPGKDELRAKFLALLAAPATSFVRVLGGVQRKVLYLLQAKVDQES